MIAFGRGACYTPRRLRQGRGVRPAARKKSEMNSNATIHQMLRYLISGMGCPMRKIPLLKLVYIADRHHLRTYGRLISGSRYMAMNKGPVPYEAKVEIERIQNGWTSADGITALPQDGHYVFTAVPPSEDELAYLSKTDRKSLDAALKVARRETADGLVEFTHCFPEWRNVSGRLNKADAESSAPMDVMDFFLDAPDGKEYCDADRELVALNREWCGDFGV